VDAVGEAGDELDHLEGLLPAREQRHVVQHRRRCQPDLRPARSHESADSRRRSSALTQNIQSGKGLKVVELAATLIFWN
jgi:hypothetical protein